MDELEKKKQQTQQINPAVAASLRGDWFVGDARSGSFYCVYIVD